MMWLLHYVPVGRKSMNAGLRLRTNSHILGRMTMGCLCDYRQHYSVTSLLTLVTCWIEISAAAPVLTPCGDCKNCDWLLVFLMPVEFVESEDDIKAVKEKSNMARLQLTPCVDYKSCFNFDHSFSKSLASP